MALDFPVTLPVKGDNGVCQSNHQRKRTHDGTSESSLQLEAKKTKTTPLPSLNLNNLSNAQQWGIPPSEQTYQQPVRGPDVHFTIVDYNLPATTIEDVPVSPRSTCSQTSGPVGSMVTNSSATTTGAEAKESESLFTTANFLFTPEPSFASTPFPYFPESPSPANSSRDSFTFPRGFAGLPNFEQLESPSSLPSSTAATFGSSCQEPLCRSPWSPCSFWACHHCHSHAMSLHHRPSAGWRRASSMTLPACFRDHMFSPCHDAFMAPHSAPLPVEPTWQPNVHHQHVHTAPLFPSDFTWLQASQNHSFQAAPEPAADWMNTAGPNFGGTTWAGDLPLHHQDAFPAPRNNFLDEPNNEATEQTASTESQSWIHHADSMRNDAGHWYI